MNSIEHHDAAIEHLAQARKMMDHVLKALTDANKHLAHAPKVSADHGTSHMSAYLSGFVTSTIDGAENIQKQISECSTFTANVRDKGELL